MMRPVKVASKSLYETSAVSLFARLPTPTLLAARGFSTRRSYVTHAVTLIFPADFRAKERLLAVYRYCQTFKSMHERQRNRLRTQSFVQNSARKNILPSRIFRQIETSWRLLKNAQEVYYKLNAILHWSIREGNLEIPWGWSQHFDWFLISRDFAIQAVLMETIISSISFRFRKPTN